MEREEDSCVYRGLFVPARRKLLPHSLGEMSLLAHAVGRNAYLHAMPRRVLASASAGRRLRPSSCAPELGMTRLRLMSHEASGDRSQYQDIRSNLYRDRLWHTLAEDTALAGSVQKLAILATHKTWADIKDESLPATYNDEPEPGERDPVWLEHDDQASDVERLRTIEALRLSETLLLNALRSMQNLEYFEWDANPPVLSAVNSLNDVPASEDVWTVLKTLKSLRRVRAADLTCDWYLPEWRMDASPRMVTSGVRCRVPKAFDVAVHWVFCDFLGLGP